MIIRKVDLENFLSHSKTSLEFNGTVNVIIGHNGAGKSSIIDSIMFALFRKTLRDVKKQEDLVKKGPSKIATVTLTLEDKGKNYIIKRSAPARASAEDTISEVLSDGNRRTIARGGESVTRKIQEVLGLDDETLRSTVIVGQGKIESVFDDLPDIVKTILKIDKIEKLRDSNGPIKELLDEINLKIKELSQIENLLQNYRLEKQKKETQISNIEKELAILIPKEEEEKKKLAEIKTLVEEEEEKEKKYYEIKSTLKSLNDEIARLKSEIIKEPDLRQRKEKIEEELLELNNLTEKKEKLINLKRDLELISSKENNIKILKRDLNDLETKLAKKNELKPFFDKYTSIRNQLNELEEKESEYNSIVDQIKSLERNLKQIEEKLNNIKLTEDPKKLEEELDRMNKELEEKTTIREKLSGQLGEIKGKLDEISNTLTNLNQVKGTTCPVCGRELTEEHKSKIVLELSQKKKEFDEQIKRIKIEINSINSYISNLNLKIKEKTKQKDKAIRDQAEYNTLVTRRNELTEEIKEKREKEKELENIHNSYIELKEKEKELKPKYEEYLKYSDVDENKIETKRKEVEKLEEEVSLLRKNTEGYDLNRIQMELNDIDKKIKELEKKKNELINIESSLTTIEKYKRTISEDEEKVTSLENELKSLNFDENKLKELKNNSENIENKLKQIQVKIGQLNGSLNVLKEDISKLEEQIKEYEDKLKNKTKLLSAYDKLKKLRDALAEDNLQAYLMNTVRSFVENSLNNILSKFDLSFSRVEIDFKERNNINAYNTSGQKLSVNLLSGGERVSIALALRLALAKTLMSEIGFLILDEPTVNLDEYRKKELIEIIRSTVEVVPQIIVVTHDEELVQAGDNIIKVEKRGDASKVEVVKID